MTVLKWLEQDEPFIPFESMALHLLDIGMQRGATSHELLSGTRLFYEQCLSDPPNISVKSLNTIIQNTLQLQQPDISFQVGQHLLPGTDPHLAKLLYNCHCTRECLAFIITHQQRLFPFVELQLVETPLYFKLYLRDRFNSFSKNAEALKCWHLESVISAMTSFINWRTNKSLTTTIQLPFEKPLHSLLYQQAFGLNVKFEHATATISFSQHLLDEPWRDRSEGLYQLSKTKTDNLPSMPLSFISKVRKTLEEQSSPPLTLPELAENFGLSPATLKRKLAKHQTNYQMLLDETRMVKAIELIEDRGYDKQAVANYFSIEDRSNFRRTWKRWLAYR